MNNDINGWWMDSGATLNIAKIKINLTKFIELNKGEQIIYMGNCTGLDVVGFGTYKLDLGNSTLVLKDVLFIPVIRHNLNSVPAFIKNGMKVQFCDNKFSIGKDNEVFDVGIYEPVHGLFKLSIEDRTENNDVDTSDFFFQMIH